MRGDPSRNTAVALVKLPGERMKPKSPRLGGLYWPGRTFIEIKGTMRAASAGARLST